jgi:glycosyltransferase involved in cell wall biosynthesis
LTDLRATSDLAAKRQETPLRAPDISGEVFLSVVIPVYNEAPRIPSTLRRVVSYLESLEKSYEVVVVDDGSTDETVPLVEKACRETPAVRLLRNPANCGKGLTVRNGMLHARGAYVLFTDADLSAPIEEAEQLLKPLREGYQVAIGSRGLRRDWIGVHQPGMRETAGKLFNLALRWITGLNFRDTQCGFKAFRREAARAIFAVQTIPGFGFDVEVLYVARKFGLPTLEVPVHWDHGGASKVHILRDGIGMFLDLLRIRWNDWSGRYRQNGLVMDPCRRSHAS